MKLPETLPSEWFQKQFDKRLGRPQFAEAKEVWDSLRQAGCEPSVLLASLEVYCYHAVAREEDDPSVSYIQEFLEANASLVAEAKKLAMDAEQVASRIEQMNRRAEISRELTFWDEAKPSLAIDLRAYASWLKATAEEILSPFNLRGQPGQLLNYVSGYIKKMTGNDGISDLTKLLRVGYAVVGIDSPDEILDEDSVGKVIRRARQRLKKLQIKK